MKSPESKIPNAEPRMQSAQLLRKISRTWPKRSQVRGESRLHSLWSDEVDLKKPDFLTNLLPFHQSKFFNSAPQTLKHTLLSCGWIIYNEKTLEIESKIVSPACQKIIDRALTEQETPLIQQAAAETLVDESFHTLLSVKAGNFTREIRNLTDLQVKNFNITHRLSNEQCRNPETWKKNILLFTTALVSELVISGYLGLLAKDTSIQPLNRQVVDAHRRDELSHAGIFKQFARQTYPKLSQRQKTFFIQVLPLPLQWFCDLELNVWSSVLRQLGIGNSEQWLANLNTLENHPLKQLDFSELVTLTQELGIADTSLWQDSFFGQFHGEPIG